METPTKRIRQGLQNVKVDDENPMYKPDVPQPGNIDRKGKGAALVPAGVAQKSARTPKTRPYVSTHSATMRPTLSLTVLHTGHTMSQVLRTLPICSRATVPMNGSIPRTSVRNCPPCGESGGARPHLSHVN